jgi:uncharacterized Zn finger protein
MAYRGWSRYDGGYGRWAPYVSAAERRANAAASAKRLEKERGRPLAPVRTEGRTIARSFWGKAWCEHLEAYSDFSNRLPRGRTYVRNGSVIDLEIAKGKITALVSGSSIYELTITIDTLPRKTWKAIQRDCARSIASLIDLLQGRFDRGVMERLTQPADGLFPKPSEIRMECSCPDYAGMCKHVAAVLYGVGARLDHSPEMLFTLRNVDHLDLIGQALAADNLDQALVGESADAFNPDDLGQLFGVELDATDGPAAGRAPRRRPSGKSIRIEPPSGPKPKARRKTTSKPPTKRGQSKAQSTAKASKGKSKAKPGSSRPSTRANRGKRTAHR